MSPFSDLMSIFLQHVMDDQSIVIQEATLWLIICQTKDQFINMLNESCKANPNAYLPEEIQKHNKSLHQLKLVFHHKFDISQLENLKGKIVNKESKPNNHFDTHNLSSHSYITKEILDFEEPNVENNHEPSLNPGIDQ